MGFRARCKVAREELDGPGPKGSNRDRAGGAAYSSSGRALPTTRAGDGRGLGRGRRLPSTLDAARRTRRRLGPLSGRRACQSLLSSANHRAPRLTAAHWPTGPQRRGRRVGGSDPPTAKVSEWTRALAQTRPCHSTPTDRQVTGKDVHSVSNRWLDPRTRLGPPFTHYPGLSVPKFRFIIIVIAILTNTLSAYYAPDALISASPKMERAPLTEEQG